MQKEEKIVKLTNNSNFPSVIADAVCFDSYNPGDSWRTVTELCAPPRIANLRRLHKEEIIEDVGDRFYTFQGVIVHAFIENAAKKRAIEGQTWLSEQRIFKEVCGKKISGAFDLFHPETGLLVDVKYSTAYKYGKRNEDWEWQTNILAHLLRTKGHKVERIQITLIMRDHSKAKAKTEPNYPEIPGAVIEIPVWPDEEVAAFLEKRVKLHMQAEREEVECTPNERYAEPEKWAVKKRNTKYAIRNGVFTSEEKAKELLEALGPNYFIEHRPAGISKRCEEYCNVKNFCAQYKNMLPRGGK